MSNNSPQFKPGTLLKCKPGAPLFSHPTTVVGLLFVKPDEIVTVLEHNKEWNMFETYKVLYENKIFYIDYKEYHFVKVDCE
jgi:hypothetical protein